MRKFGLGQPVRRSEDPRLVTGRGRFVADVSLPGQAYAVVLRSPHAHADILSVDVSAAAAAPGVVSVLTAAEVADDGLGDIPCEIRVRNRDGHHLPIHGRRLLAREQVRFVGEPVAMVVAETRAAAEAAAELVDVDYRPLAAVATIEDALAAGAPRVWDEAPDNLAFYSEIGDAAAVDGAFAAAHRVVSLDLINNRVAACPMEPRGAVGAFDANSGRYTLYTTCQGAHFTKYALARHSLRVPEDAIRVVVGDVGGGFGAKIFHYPEEALVLWGSRRLGRPVKWVGERGEAFIGDVHGRDHRSRVEGAFDESGRLIALRVRTHSDMGAYLNGFAPANPASGMNGMLSGVYAIPAVFATVEGVFTHTVPIDAYRGAGRPEATYLIERFMDHAARALGLRPDEIRRRNFIRPEQMPYTTATGQTYDCGDFEGVMDAALAAADVAGFPERRAMANAKDRLRGLGFCTYVEVCGFNDETATIQFTDDGALEVLIGTQSNGQGHETAYAQIVAGVLGVPMEAVRVVQGDTDRIVTGRGTGGSRSLPVGGPAVQAAAEAVIARGCSEAARLLQARESEIRFVDGRFEAGDGRGFGVLELAAAARSPANRPPGGQPAGLDAEARYKIGASTYPNGCHVCEVEIDRLTGAVDIVGYHVVDDFGTVVNPLLLAGQIHGGVAQGIGQALMEEVVYDRESGQLLSGSFVDYAVPRASDLPDMDLTFRGVPCTTNPLGIKGAGEAGTIAACPAVVSAVLDALAPHGVSHLDMPVTPEKIWRALRDAAAGASNGGAL